MNYKATVSKLWEQLEEALIIGYNSNEGVKEHLRDYVPDMGHRDALAALAGREMAAEREHRKFGPNWSQYHGSISVGTAARLMVLHQIGIGAKLDAMPPATEFIRFRPTAVEAQVVGYLLRDVLKPEWVAEAVALDYAKAVAA